MRVKNRNVGTPMLAHYCPNCDTELEFPNTAALMELLGL